MTTDDKKLQPGSEQTGADLRKKAEANLREKTTHLPELPEDLSLEEIRLKLHELQVHQIELELQNEELRRVQAELAVERAKYFELYNLAPVGCITLSEQGLILGANLTAVTLLGNARETLVNQPLTRFILPDDQDFLYLSLKKLSQSDGPQAFDLRMVRKNEMAFWVNLSVTTALDAEGVPLYRVVMSDITDRKWAEEALQKAYDEMELRVAERTSELTRSNEQFQRESDERKNAVAALRKSEERFRTIYENAPVLINGFDDNGRCLLWNNQCRKVFGWTIDEINAQGDVLSLFYPDPAERDEVMQTIAEPDGCFREWHPRTKDGQTLSNMWANYRLPDGTVISLGYDITEIKRITSIFKARAHLFEYSNNHSLDELLEETLNVVERLTDSQISFHHFVNPDQKSLTLQNWSTQTKSTFCSAAGKGDHYEIAQAGVWVDCFHQRKPVIHNDYESLSHKKGMPPSHAEVVRELVVPVFRGDNIVAILGVGNKLSDYEQRDVEIVSMFADLSWDITEGKRAEEELFIYRNHLEELVQKRTAELEATNKEMHAFTYKVSHDLRAPLRHVDGFLELLRKKAEATLDEQGQHYMDAISEASQKMGLLIDNLLDFSRMGRHTISFQPVELEPLVRDVIRELEPDTAGRDIAWRIGDLPVVTGDPSFLRIVLVHLIANALKFTRPRQQAKIEIGSLPGRASEIVIFVRDNGVGFDMKYADKMFGVFRRLHRPEEFEGTGIGLAHGRRIIARHGGQTWAEGQLNQGATFYFSLPKTIQES